jgi:Rps23 Pro-64 3,4-dihydroxylase Tpa1-like proline 4-hydroxylase
VINIEMPDLQTEAGCLSIFSYSSCHENLAELSRQYQANCPVPHIYLSDFIDPEAAAAAAAEFPQPDSDAWTHYQHQNENKHGMTKRALFPPTVGEVSDALNSEEFLAWLAELSGIPGLMADASLEGGGLHQSGRGGYLNVHTDFSHHHYNKNWKRRINLILYLNEGWQEEWGGAIELWDDRMRRSVAQYPCGFNCALIFNTDDRSFHGFPEPLTCPSDVSRKSLAFYYYTAEAEGKSPVRSTNYRARPGDGLRKSALIWIDKQAVNLYSRAKTIFGFSDDAVSRILGRRSRKRP